MDLVDVLRVAIWLSHKHPKTQLAFTGNPACQAGLVCASLMRDFVDRDQAGVNHRSGARKLCFAECLQRANNFEVTERRDMVYAPLGLTDGPTLQPERQTIKRLCPSYCETPPSLPLPKHPS